MRKKSTSLRNVCVCLLPCACEEDSFNYTVLFKAGVCRCIGVEAIICISAGSSGFKKKKERANTPTLTQMQAHRGQMGLLRHLPSCPTKTCPVADCVPQSALTCGRVPRPGNVFSLTTLYSQTPQMLNGPRSLGEWSDFTSIPLMNVQTGQ